jgi:hypothetical protein
MKRSPVCQGILYPATSFRYNWFSYALNELFDKEEIAYMLRTIRR